MLGIERGEAGWHTFYLCRHARGAPVPHAAEAMGQVLAYGLTRLRIACGRPWRRLGALLRARV